MPSSDLASAHLDPLAATPQTRPAQKGGTVESAREWLRQKPLAKRLTLLHLLSSAITAGFLALVAIVIILSLECLAALRSITTVASLTADRVSRSVSNGENPATSLMSLTGMEGFRAAAIYGTAGEQIARVQISETRLGERWSGRLGAEWSLASLRYGQSVPKAAGSAGTLVVEFGLQAMWAEGVGLSLLAIAAATGGMLLGRALQKRLACVIREPFVELRRVVEGIRPTGTLNLRGQTPKDPRVKRLVSRLESLLAELRERQTQLNDAKLDLELNVLTRTSELQQQIEDRKKAEIALRDSEGRYRALFENNPMPMFVMDLESLRFLAVNAAALDHYGYSGREFAELNLSALTHPDESANVYRAFIRDPQAFDAGEWRHLRKSGEVITVELTAHTIAFADRPAKIVLANDVTERNRAQQALTEANKQLLSASRRAGMAEVATGVLHNVGNVLNSVNVSASVLAESIQASKAAGIGKVAALFNTNRKDLAAFFSKKGATLCEYLSGLTAQLERERAHQLSELTLLSKNISHIKEIVAMQQDYAKSGGMVEQQSARELVAEAIELTAADVQNAGTRVRVECEDDVKDVVTDRHKALQILVNLISNARQAMAETPAEDRLIRIRLEKTAASKVAIRVIDRGCGIPAENLTKIFIHGFTTKMSGHGFGLHSSANAAKELGGRIAAASEGSGKGATFTVELPTSR